MGRGREVVSDGQLGLRLRSDHATGGHPGLAWRQGALLGAALLLATAWASLVAPPTGPPRWWPRRRWPRRWWRWSPRVAGPTPSRSRLRRAGRHGGRRMVAVLVGAGGRPRRTGRGRRPGPGHEAVPGGAWRLVALMAVGLAAAAGGAAVAGATALATTLVVPAVLVVLGGADAGWAAAAVAWAWRFLALDPTDVLDAGRALAAGHGLHPVLVRLAAMGAGVAAAVALARHSARRASL